MPNTLRGFLAARTTVLLLLCLLTLSLLLASLLPQGAAPLAAPSAGQRLIRLLSLDQVRAAWWFRALLACLCLSLVLSLWEQFAATRHRLSRLPGPGLAGLPLSGPVDDLVGRLTAHGYRPLAQDTSCRRYVKFASGYWGGFLLHLGMVVTLGFAGLYLLTEQRLILRAVLGEATPLSSGTQAERTGVLPSGRPRPAAITLQDLSPTFWDNGALKSLSSALLVHDLAGGSQPLRLGINQQASHQGFTVCQQGKFGHIFLLEWRQDDAPPFRLTLDLPMPPARDKAAYGDFDLQGGYRLRAKYYADGDWKSVASLAPRLVLRLHQGPQLLLGETSLRAGDAGRLGPFQVRLLEVAWWADFLLDGSRGMGGIFLGFFLLLGGGLLFYLVVPRELVIWQTDAGHTVQWRAARFADFYQDEAAALLSPPRQEQR